MRISKNETWSAYKIAVLDDDSGIIDAISVILEDYGYKIVGFTNPYEAIEELKKNKYDLLILDYLMDILRGDKVVEKIREFDEELYILLLTGHKDIAPPLETLNNLDIQSYCEKSSRFDQLILLITSGLKSVSQTKTIKKYKDGLNNVLKAVPKLYKLETVEKILDQILLSIIKLVSVKNAFILIDDINGTPSEEYKSIFSGIGLYNVDADTFMSMLSPVKMEKIGYARENKETVIIESAIILPLISEKGIVMGVIYIEDNMFEDNIRFLEIYTKNAAVSLSNAFLHSLISIKNYELSNTYNLLNERYMNAIEFLRLTVDAKDVYTRGHSDRVSYFAVMLGEQFNLKDDELELLRLGGIFHDVGKIGTSDNVLFKMDKLNEVEYDEIKRHTVTGSYILSAVSMFKDVVPLVKYHHERIDGKGYPEGLKGDDIPFLARILSVADAFDAMTSDRLYRKRIDLKDAIRQMKLGSDRQFDSKIVEKLILILDDYDTILEELRYTHE